MGEFLPILIVGGIIGFFTLILTGAFFILRRKKEEFEDRERNMSDREIIARLMQYAKPYQKRFVLVFFIMLFSIVYDLLSPLLIGRIQDLIKDSFELPQLYALVAVYYVVVDIPMEVVVDSTVWISMLLTASSSAPTVA